MRISLTLKIERTPRPEPEPQPEGAYATVETAPEHYPLGFTPNQAEAKDKGERP